MKFLASEAKIQKTFVKIGMGQAIPADLLKFPASEVKALLKRHQEQNWSGLEGQGAKKVALSLMGCL